MKNPILYVIILLFMISMLTACSQKDRQALVVEEYLTALVAKDSTRLTTLTCSDWTPSALNELNSFQAVTASLQDMSCRITGVEDEWTLVVCSGDIVTSYNGENQEIDLSVRTYQVVFEGGEFLICGCR